MEAVEKEVVVMAVVEVVKKISIALNIIKFGALKIIATHYTDSIIKLTM